MSDFSNLDHFQLLRRQARRLQEELPELFEHLVEQEAQILRHLRAIPSPADVERAAVFDASRHLHKLQGSMEHGISSLVDSKIDLPHFPDQPLRLLKFEQRQDCLAPNRTSSRW